VPTKQSGCSPTTRAGRVLVAGLNEIGYLMDFSKPLIEMYSDRHFECSRARDR
jgi:hypothetical protein